MSTGNITQIIGAVIDVEFPKENLPKVFDALEVDETGLILEVQQQAKLVLFITLRILREYFENISRIFR